LKYEVRSYKLEEDRKKKREKRIDKLISFFICGNLRLLSAKICGKLNVGKIRLQLNNLECSVKQFNIYENSDY